MNIFEKYYNCHDINRIIDTINDVIPLEGCHGRYHTTFVVDMVEYILKSLSYDARTIEIGKIAALLHDIGSIAGRQNHAQKSASLASVFLEEHDFKPEEKATIIQAIKDHSDAKNISSAIGAAVYIADKADIAKRRVLPSDNMSLFNKNLLEIEDVGIRISEKSMTINYITTDAFSKETLLTEYIKKFEVSAKAARCLGCTYHLQFNGLDEFVYE